MISDTMASGDHAASLPDTTQAKDLKTVEHVMLWTIRTWVWSIQESGHAGEHFEQGLKTAGCSDAITPLGSLLNTIGVAATRSIEIHKSGCPLICPDEKRFLHALASQQTGHALEAFDVLSEFLPGTAVRLVLEQAGAVASSLTRAGLFFPDRVWALDELSLTHCLRAPRSSTTCVRYMIH